MKITSVSTRSYTYRYKEDESFGNGVRWNYARSCVIVEVHTDEGIIGYGEADCAGGPPTVTAFIVENEIAPLIIGRDPMCVEEIWAHWYHSSMIHGRRGAVVAAYSGIDIALWDIMGKVLNQPIYRLLGGHKNRLEAYHSGGFYHHVDNPAKEAEIGLKNNYRGFKMKIGRLDLAGDLKRISEVREVIGPKCKLMVDANNAYATKPAVQMAERMLEHDVYWFEEPVSTDDPQGSAKVAATGMNVAGYETEHTLYGFRQIIDAGAVDIVQCDVIRSGGYTECRKIAALSQAHKLPCTSHIFSSGMSMLANMHFVAAMPNCDLLEYDANPYPLRTEMFKDYIPIVEEDGKVTMPEGPGLGAEINYDAIEPWRVK